MTTKFAFHCSACGASLNNFEHSKKLPNGDEDDMCSYCTDAIHSSNYAPYKDHAHLGVTEGITQSFSLEELDLSNLEDNLLT